MDALPLRPRPFPAHALRSRLRGSAVPVLAAGAGIAASLATEGGPGGALGAGLAAVTVAIAAIDARRFLIPDGLNALGVALGLAYAATLPAPAEAMAAALLRGMLTALAFLALRAGYRHLRGREGLGLGDVKLAAVAGVWLDWTTIPVAIDMAALAALAAVGLRQAWTGRMLKATGRLPFGLFLAPAIFIGWLGERWLASGF